jgi:hypothetical protein
MAQIRIRIFFSKFTLSHGLTGMAQIGPDRVALSTYNRGGASDFFASETKHRILRGQSGSGSTLIVTRARDDYYALAGRRGQRATDAQPYRNFFFAPRPGSSLAPSQWHLPL